ncbi:putative uncharacterized protein DDB_G0290521 [Clytia hemisphaerica]|uniref:putative uncharacterized protein DDB_G0290521 n=1 Tax=Clytia hemisphaerica TaxID=252671 RepID=UPI0034D5B737
MNEIPEATLISPSLVRQPLEFKTNLPPRCLINTNETLPKRLTPTNNTAKKEQKKLTKLSHHKQTNRNTEKPYELPPPSESPRKPPTPKNTNTKYDPNKIDTKDDSPKPFKIRKINKENTQPPPPYKTQETPPPPPPTSIQTTLSDNNNKPTDTEDEIKNFMSTEKRRKRSIPVDNNLFEPRAKRLDHPSDKTKYFNHTYSMLSFNGQEAYLEDKIYSDTPPNGLKIPEIESKTKPHLNSTRKRQWERVFVDASLNLARIILDPATEENEKHEQIRKSIRERLTEETSKQLDKDAIYKYKTFKTNQQQRKSKNH